MTLGTGTYSPAPQFSFPRSYAKGWVVEVTTDLLAFSNNVCIFYSYPTHTQEFHIVLLPEAWEWSSNRYTLDHLVVESWYRNLPSTTEIPMPFHFQWWQRPDTVDFYWKFAPFSIPFLDYHYNDAPAADVPYWLYGTEN